MAANLPPNALPPTAPAPGRPGKILAIAAWHGRLARPGLTALFGVYAAVQFAMLLIAAVLPANLGCSYAALFLRAGQVAFFLLGGLAALGLSAAAVWPGGPRADALRMLPGARWKLQAGQVLLCAAVAVGFVAWQLVLYAAFYPPVAAVSAWRTLAAIEAPQALPTGGMYDQLAQNPLWQLLLPTYPLGWAALAIDLAALAVQGGCLFFHRGWRRLAAALLALPTAGGALALPVLAGMIRLRDAAETRAMGLWPAFFAVAALTALPAALQWVGAEIMRD